MWQQKKKLWHAVATLVNQKVLSRRLDLSCMNIFLWSLNSEHVENLFLVFACLNSILHVILIIFYVSTIIHVGQVPKLCTCGHFYCGLG